MPTSLAPHSLHVDIHDGNGPPVLLVHGIMGGRALWNANLDALKAIASPVVVELYGHGRSPVPINTRTYQWASYVDVFDQIRADLGAERWFVIGQSLGAALTLRYVLSHPDRIVGHVITNSVSALSKRVATTAELEIGARQLDEGGRDALMVHPLNPARSRRIVPIVREALVADQGLLDPNGIAMAMRHTVADVSSRAHVSKNQVPTLIVAGTREVAFEEPCAFAEANMPFVRIHRIADAGHSPNAETPEVFNEVVTMFFARLSEEATA